MGDRPEFRKEYSTYGDQGAGPGRWEGGGREGTWQLCTAEENHTRTGEVCELTGWREQQEGGEVRIFQEPQTQ